MQKGDPINKRGGREKKREDPSCSLKRVLLRAGAEEDEIVGVMKRRPGKMLGFGCGGGGGGWLGGVGGWAGVGGGGAQAVVNRRGTQKDENVGQ